MKIQEKILELGFEKTVSNDKFIGFKKSFSDFYKTTCCITINKDKKPTLDFHFHNQHSSSGFMRKNVTIRKIKQILKALFE